MNRLRDFTIARVGLGRAGNSVPTKSVLEFQLAHARARDAVHCALDLQDEDLQRDDLQFDLALESAAANRSIFLRRPDLGRSLSERSRRALAPYPGPFDIVILAIDGLSALAVHHHAAPVLKELLKYLDAASWSRAPLIAVVQGRVAIGDEVGSLVGAAMSLVLIGERLGLSSPDSLGAYLTWHPKPGRTEAERNCISNIRPEGLAYGTAALRIFRLLSEARTRKLTGFGLKEDQDGLANPATAIATGERR